MGLPQRSGSPRGLQDSHPQRWAHPLLVWQPCPTPAVQKLRTRYQQVGRAGVAASPGAGGKGGADLGLTLVRSWANPGPNGGGIICREGRVKVRPAGRTGRSPSQIVPAGPRAHTPCLPLLAMGNPGRRVPGRDPPVPQGELAGGAILGRKEAASQDPDPRESRGRADARGETARRPASKPDAAPRGGRPARRAWA